MKFVNHVLVWTCRVTRCRGNLCRGVIYERLHKIKRPQRQYKSNVYANTCVFIYVLIVAVFFLLKIKCIAINFICTLMKSTLLKYYLFHCLICSLKWKKCVASFVCFSNVTGNVFVNIRDILLQSNFTNKNASSHVRVRSQWYS